MRNAIKIAGLIASLSLLFACGGGGGGGGHTSSSTKDYYACVVNSGTSPSVATYSVDADDGSLSSSSLSTIDMTGKTPQWIVAHPTLNVVYVPAEDNHVYAYSIDEDSGALALINSAATGDCDTASITRAAAISPNGDYLYVANNKGTAHSISYYTIAGDGSLTLQGALDMLAGNIAHDMVVDPDSQYLYVLDITLTILRAYTIAPGGGLSLAATDTMGLNPRTLAVRSNNLYVNISDDLVCQYTDQPTPLTRMAPFSAAADGDGSDCTVVGNHFYRYANWPVASKGIHRATIASNGALTDQVDFLSLTWTPSHITGGVDSKFLYLVYPDNDHIGWATRNATTGALTSPNSTGVGDYPVCMTVLKLTH